MANNGFTQVPNEVIKDSYLTIQARMIYIFILSKAWTSNKAFPGHKLIAETMGVSTKTVGKYLQELKTADLISWKRRGLNKTNLYTLNKWKTSGLEGKNLPVKEVSIITSKNGSQLPINKTQIKKTKSERANTLSNDKRAGKEKEVNYMEIIDTCKPYLEEVSLQTGVSLHDVRGVLKKMASYYSAEGRSFSNWIAKLTNWVLKDLEDERLELDFFVIEEIKKKERRERIINLIISILGENWDNNEDLVKKINDYLSSKHGFATPLSEVQNYLETLRVDS